MKISALVLAAGAGRRFRRTAKTGFPLNKVFYPLGSRPMFTYSLGTLSQSKEVCEIILAVPSDLAGTLRKKYVRKGFGRKISSVVAGGKERSDSCLKAFQRTRRDATHILIHDAARPLLSAEALKKLIQVARRSDGAILGKPLAPTIKQANQNNHIEATIPREKMWEAETPQIFKRSILDKAFRFYKTNPAPVSDDAGLCERIGAKIKLVENLTPNIKITTFSDFYLAEKLLSNGSVGYAKHGIAQKWGTGYDIHRIVPKRKFMLGGVKISDQFGALGHSDGDALLHAVTDALLGASGLGDIGDWFPDSDKRYRGASSAYFLRKVVKHIKDTGWKPVHVDTTIHLERPKLARIKEKIRSRLARLLSLDKKNVNIKAKTHEGLGAIGRAKAVAAEAIVTLGMNHG